MKLYRGGTDARAALVVGFRGEEGGHLVGFDYYRQELLRKLGLQITRVDADSLAAVESAVDQTPCDVAFISLDWRWRDFADAAHVELFRRLFQRDPRPRLVLLDCVDQTSSPFFELLPYVDAFGKAKLLRDLKLYHEDYLGGFIFTDWFSRRYQFDLTGWYFGSRLPPGQESKLVPIWSFGSLPLYQRRLLWNWVVPGRWERRRLDLNVRFTPGPSHEWKWYHEHRAMALDAARGLSSGIHLSGEGRIPRYLEELKFPTFSL